MIDLTFINTFILTRRLNVHSLLDHIKGEIYSLQVILLQTTWDDGQVDCVKLSWDICKTLVEEGSKPDLNTKSTNHSIEFCHSGLKNRKALDKKTGPNFSDLYCTQWAWNLIVS